MHCKKRAAQLLVFLFLAFSAFSFAQTNQTCSGESIAFASVGQAYGQGQTFGAGTISNAGASAVSGRVGWELVDGSTQYCANFSDIAPGSTADFSLSSCNPDLRVSIVAVTSCGSVARKQVVDPYSYAGISFSSVSGSSASVSNTGKLPLNVTIFGFSKVSNALVSCSGMNVVAAGGSAQIPLTCTYSDMLYFKAKTTSDTVFDVKPVSSDVFKLLAGDEAGFSGYKVKLTTVQNAAPNIAYFDVTSSGGTVTSKSVQIGSNETIGGVNVRVFEASSFAQYPVQTAAAVVSLSVPSSPTSVCGNGACESGESSSNCCTDCPSNTGSAGVAYGSWYCRDSLTKERVVTTTSYACNNQTNVFGPVIVNSTETQACSSGTYCSNGNCILNQTNATQPAPVCGNGVCDAGEAPNVCSECAGAFDEVLDTEKCTTWHAGNVFNYAPCGDTKVYEVTPGASLRFSAYGDGCSNCVCYYVNFDVYDYVNGGWVKKKSVDEPDVRNAQKVFDFVPEGSKVKVVGTSGCFHFNLYKPKSQSTNATMSCTDSDGGKNYYTPGTAKGIYGGINGFSTDYCSEGTNSAGLPVNLVEFYCNGSQTYTSDPYNCPNGCSNGACLSATNATVPTPACGNDVCDGSETYSSCPKDCFIDITAMGSDNSVYHRGDRVILTLSTSIQGTPLASGYVRAYVKRPDGTKDTVDSFSADNCLSKPCALPAGVKNAFYALSPSAPLGRYEVTADAQMGGGLATFSTIYFYVEDKEQSGGPKWVDGKFGKALDFDGANDYVDVSSIADDISSAQGTISVWFKGTGYLMAASNPGVYRDYFEFNTGVVSMRPNTDYKWHFYLDPQVSSDSWHNFVLVQDGTEPSLYIDGILKPVEFTSRVMAGFIKGYWFKDYRATRFDIGSFRTNGNPESYFKGTIDDFRVYDRALTAEEARSLATGASVSDGLVGWWKFDEGSGSVAKDSSGRGNDGRLFGAKDVVVPVELSLATDRGSYSVGDVVKISAKTASSGALVNADLKGYVTRPDGVRDELVFATEACTQPSCPPGALCSTQLTCATLPGIKNAVYKPVQDGAHYVSVVASSGSSSAESSVKFWVGRKKVLKLQAWLEKYDFRPGDKVKILAKLVDSGGNAVRGADVYASVHRPLNAKLVSKEIVGIEATAAKRVEAAQATVPNSGPEAVGNAQATVPAVRRPTPSQTTDMIDATTSTAEAILPITGYVVAGISSSVEKQVASSEGITYEENKQLTTQTSMREVKVNYPGMVIPSNSIKLDYNPSSGYYEGVYTVPSDASSGKYSVSVLAGADGQRLSESTSFSVGGGEDYVSFESKARQSALNGRYEDCKTYYLKAAGKISGDQRRMLLDIEKAGICARLGNLPNGFYSDAARIVERAAGEGSEKYVLLGVASQYYELGGDYQKSRELLGRAASGLDSMQGSLGRESAVLSQVILAKYYSLLGQQSMAEDYFRKAAGSFAETKGSASDAFLANIFAARLYAKAGDMDASKEQYLLAAGGLSGRSAGSSDYLISAFMAGDAYEKAGEAEKAKAQYRLVVGSAVPERYGSSDLFFSYGALGRSYERLGDKEKAKELYSAGLDSLLSKQDSESYYFAAGLSGYLGDYAQAKTLCRRLFEQSLSEDNNIGRLTMMNAYCYSVLGDSIRAKKGCDLNSVSPQSESLILEYVLEPLPPPVSYCSQSSDAKSSTCGNGAVDAGETSENCCIDTGCAFGDTCSKALNKCVRPADEIPSETILEVLMRLEEVRMKLDSLEGKALAISKYYDGKDQQRADAWNNAAKVFSDAKSRVDGITKDLKDNRGNMNEAALEGIRQKLDALRGSLREAVDAILGVYAPADSLDIKKLIGNYNNNLDKVPSFVKAILGNERINAHITLNNGTEVVIGGVSDGGRIADVRDGGIENATLEVFASEAAIRDIRSSKDRAKAVQNALDSKSIYYRTAEAATEAKLSVATRAYKLVSGLL